MVPSESSREPGALAKVIPFPVGGRMEPGKVYLGVEQAKEIILGRLARKKQGVEDWQSQISFLGEKKAELETSLGEQCMGRERFFVGGRDLFRASRRYTEDPLRMAKSRGRCLIRAYRKGLIAGEDSMDQNIVSLARDTVDKSDQLRAARRSLRDEKRGDQRGKERFDPWLSYLSNQGKVEDNIQCLEIALRRLDRRDKTYHDTISRVILDDRKTGLDAEQDTMVLTQVRERSERERVSLSKLYETALARRPEQLGSYRGHDRFMLNLISTAKAHQSEAVLEWRKAQGIGVLREVQDMRKKWEAQDAQKVPQGGFLARFKEKMVLGCQRALRLFSLRLPENSSPLPV